jgi:hypothetical protein
MSDWTWEYVPDSASVVGGLTQTQIDDVESLALRIADAVAVAVRITETTLFS